MALLDETEKDDFWNLIVKSGYRAADFELREQEETARVGGFALAGTAIVSRKSTGITRSYQAGHGKAWIAEFGNELDHQVFGQP